jgi:hypothetical protein
MDPLDPQDIFFDRHAEVRNNERHRPHWRQHGKLYFVTWRQWDSLSVEQREQLKRDREAWVKRFGDVPYYKLAYADLRRYHQLFHERVQRWLDAGYGSCVLKRADCSDIVNTALHHFDGQRSHLGSYAIAANHVHVLVLPLPGFELSDITHSWKSFTAKAINRVIGESGQLWRKESYDHIVRNPDALARIERYVLAHGDLGASVEQRILSDTHPACRPKRQDDDQLGPTEE